MQITLTENEYNSFIYDRNKLKELKDKIEALKTVTYNNDGGLAWGKMPTLETISIDKDVLIDILFNLGSYKEQAKGIIIAINSKE